MDKLVVAAVQMRMRLPATVDEFRDDMRRFVRTAEGKRARLVVFPEFAGMMLAPALLRDLRTNLIRQAEQGKRKRANAWVKLRGGAAGWLAGMLKADLRANTAALLDVNGKQLWEAYCEVFSGLAREHHLTIVAPSAYLPDPSASAQPGEEGSPSAASVLNQCAVFGETGELLGTQSKVLGSSEDEDIAQRGRTFNVIPTAAGRLGIMLGGDVLYPEVGRLLAYQDAEMLVFQGACTSMAMYNKTRAGILARMQDNQLFAVASYLAGESPLRRVPDQPYLGRSAVFAPQELTPRFNGVLVEMGSAQADGVVTAEWNFPALRQLWEESDTPIRRVRPGEDLHTLLAALYTQLRALPPPAPDAMPALSDDLDLNSFDVAEDVDLFQLSELPVVASITSTWPLRRRTRRPRPDDEDEEELPRDDLALMAAASDTAVNGPVEAVPIEEIEWPIRNYNDAPGETTIRRDDETDEMDAVDKT